MNEKKICFISCVNDDEFYFESLTYINNLFIPDGYSIENIFIKEAQSMTSGYNSAMITSDAKYKVYLHQDTFIINKNFIENILDIFITDPDVGMMGVIGSEKLSSNFVWWDSKRKLGKVCENHNGYMNLLEFHEMQDNIENACAIDGLIMITQYDVNWREDLFDGWHFYDISQCMEFKKNGYRVVIPKQNLPWCIHDCGVADIDDIKINFNKYAKIFSNEYSNYIHSA